MGPLRSTYSLERRTEPFYTGGAVVADDAGALLACACGDETKLVTLATGNVVRVRRERASAHPACDAGRWAASRLLGLRPTPRYQRGAMGRRYGRRLWDAVVVTRLAG